MTIKEKIGVEKYDFGYPCLFRIQLKKLLARSMNLGLTIILVTILLVLVISYNVFLQVRVKADSNKKQEIAKFNAIIAASEELISSAHHIPYSKELLVCLNRRILNALQGMAELSPKDSSLKQRVENVSTQIAQLQNSQNAQESTTFKVPVNDKQALTMLKLVKRLRDTLQSEHNKGRLDTQTYVAENARLESMQIRINIENVIKRAKESVQRGQSGTAKQLLRKGIDALATKNDSYSQQATEKLQQMLDDLEQSQQDKQAEHLQALEERKREKGPEIDDIFGGGEKKKW